MKFRHFVCLFTLPFLATAVWLQRQPKSVVVPARTARPDLAVVQMGKASEPPSIQAPAFTLAPTIAWEAPPAAGPMTATEFTTGGFRHRAEADFTSLNRLSACDRTLRSGSPWEEFLTGFVDPCFRRSDGWHFFNPDALGGVRETVRRPSSFAFSGGIKFSRSF